MNSKQRVMMAFKHQEPDRVPIGELAIHSPVSSAVLKRDCLTGEGGRVKMLMRDMIMKGKRKEFLDTYCRDTIDIFCELGLDIIPVELNASESSRVEYKHITDTGWDEYDPGFNIWYKIGYEPQWDVAFEQSSSFSEGGIEAIKKYVNQLEDELDSIDESRFYVLERILKEAGDEKFILAKVPNMFPAGTSWFTLFLESIYEDLDLVNRLLKQYQLRAEAVARHFCKLGVDAILNGGDWAFNSGPFVSPAHIKQLFVPQVQAIADICHENGIYLMKHTDGNVMPIEDVFFEGMDIDAFQSIEPNAGMDLGVIKKKYGEKVLLMGNVDCATVLQFGTKDEIIADTRRAIEQGKKNGGFVLSSSNSIHSAIPYENYMVMLETAKVYGEY
jgi:uroporphyrinogen decarboxylase